MFFHAFARPGIARAVFKVIEAARIRAAVSRRYPGTRRYRRSLAGCLAERRAKPVGELGALETLCIALLGVDVESRLFPLAAEVLEPLADVYTSAAATVACYEALAIGSEPEAESTERAEGTTMEWLQREARLDDWDEELADKDAEIAALEFAGACLGGGDEGRQRVGAGRRHPRSGRRSRS